jgi:hypothetical protein
MFLNCMAPTRDSVYNSTSETVLVINSESRSSGSTQQYTVVINPPVHDITEVELLSFDGTVKPFNILSDQQYYIMYTVVSVPPALSYVLSIWIGYIQAGSWTLDALLEALNANVFVRFKKDFITGRIVVEMTTSVIVGTGTQYPWIWSNNEVINGLLGFPTTFSVNAPGPVPSYATVAQWQLLSTNTLDRAIQSTFPVPSVFKPRPIQIAFENIPGQLSSGNSIGGCFVVSVDPTDPLTNESIVSWKTEKDFEQITKTNHIRLSNIGIRLCDSIDGSPYKYPGEHTIILKVKWTNNK